MEVFRREKMKASTNIQLATELFPSRHNFTNTLMSIPQTSCQTFSGPKHKPNAWKLMSLGYLFHAQIEVVNLSRNFPQTLKPN